MLKLLRSFRARADGNVAMTFALVSLPLFFAVGAAVDYSRASTSQAKLQADIDATTLILCKSTLTGVADLKTLAGTTLAAYSPGDPVIVDTLSVTSAPRAVTLSAHIVLPTTFAGLMNYPNMNVAATASCSAGETFYEIALVVDTTGSMANSAGGTSKIQALRNAATNFVNTMFSSIDTAHLKISLVPFAASVRIDPTAFANATWLDQNGKSNLHWQNVTGAAAAGFTSRFGIFKKLAAANSAWTWAGCLESLPYPLNTTDGAPSAANADSYYVPLFAPDEVGNQGDLSYRTSGSNNSYLDDGTSNAGTCDNNTSSNATRMSQACKYASPKNIMTSENGPNWMCTSRALTRLTNTKSTLLSEISNLAADGNTDIHEGLIWGWRTVSPNSVFADGAAYTTASSAVNVVKIIVVMTDGTNTWSADGNAPVTKSGYSAYGYFTNADGSKPNARLPAANANPSTSAQARAAIDALTAETCTNAKRAGVTIYSVGFSVSTDPIDSAGQSLLSNCASTSANYFLATDSTALNAAFGSIAQGIGQLRLTK